MKNLYFTWLAVVALVLGAAALAFGQPPVLSMQLQAGLVVSGTVSNVYAIEYATDLAPSNSWRCLAFLRLPATNYLWVDTSAPATGRRFYRAVTLPKPVKLIYIPANAFLMGSPTNDPLALTNEFPQTVVTLTHGFWMGQYPVTQAEYFSVVSNNPSYFTGDLSRPVDSVSYFDATNYCVTLTRREVATGNIPPGSEYRLPTEAEWEYAARAWTSTRFSYGDDPTLSGITNYAWAGSTSGFTTHAVGGKLPNPWGLYDMTGNVWEWTSDWFGPYPGGFATDPQGVAFGTGGLLGTFKAIRGGAYDYAVESCRSAQRLYYGVSPFLHDTDLGFRVVLAVKP